MVMLDSHSKGFTNKLNIGNYELGITKYKQ